MPWPRVAGTVPSHEHPQPRLPLHARLDRRDRRVRPPRQRGRHGLAQPAPGRICRAAAGRQPARGGAGWGARLCPRGRSAAGARAGGDLHPTGQRERPDRRAGRAGHPRRGGADRRAGRGAAPGHARCRSAAPAAHPGAQRHRPAGADQRHERQLRPHRRGTRRAGLRLAIGRAGHRDAGLGEGPRHRLFAGGVAGRACRHRLRRHARLAGQRSTHPGDPALHRVGHLGAQVHVGRACGGAQQAGDRGQVGPLAAGPARGGLAHRRAGRCRLGGGCGHPPRRHVAGGHVAGFVSRRRDAGALARQPRRAPAGADQRRWRRRDGRRCRRPCGHRTGRAGPGHAGQAGRGAAGQLVARQSAGHHRRRAGCALCADAAGAGRRPRGRGGAVRACAHRHRAQRRHRPRAGAAGAAAAGPAAAPAGLLAGRAGGGVGAPAVQRRRHRLLSHARRGGACLRDAGGLSPQPGPAAGDPGRTGG